MTFQPRPGQEAVLTVTNAVVVALGGAGTGKTTVAAAAVRQILDRAAATRGPRRALFLSFSRAAVSQIVDRMTTVLGPQADYVEITTFHAFAWSLLRRWGN